MLFFDSLCYNGLNISRKGGEFSGLIENRMEFMKICFCSGDRTLSFAAAELRKYLTLMGNDGISLCFNGQESSVDKITLGTFTDLNLPEKDLYSAENKFDDHIVIDIANGTGFISGSNSRSVLLGVYRFLTEAGLRWVRPGYDGEIICKKNVQDLTCKINEKPAYRHRGLCIEGANRIENILDIVDWLPKVGMNAYFIQFREGFTFFDRWYSHHLNDQLVKTGFTVEDARRFVKIIEDEIDKRGLIYHAVGHGWTCEPLGIPGTAWEEVDPNTIPKDAYQYFAEVNGERDLWYKVPLNTNLCYSNPKVLDLMAQDVVRYLTIRPRIDILHIWLADGSNNQCECENCRKALPSDFYIKFLNLVDSYLTEKNIETKIVFLIYVDLLWPPQIEKLNNPDRFIMMFAPITRSYTASFSADKPIPDILPYNRNKLIMPKKVEENIAHLKAWQKIFSGDSFDFDYHMMWDHYNDPGYYFNSRILYQDIKNLADIGLNGFNSCQVQRAFYPTGLPMYVMVKTLWNTNIAFDDIAVEYFNAAYGTYGPQVLEYMKTLSELFDPYYIRGEKQFNDPEALEKFNKVPNTIQSFDSVIKEGLMYPDSSVAQSFLYLDIHAKGALIYADFLRLAASGSIQEAKEKRNEFFDYYRKNEMLVQNVLDVYEMINTMQRKRYWTER
jgi:hypothetical protein